MNEKKGSKWTFITNHGAVLALIHAWGKITARQMAQELGITERSVLRILDDLEEAGYIRRTRQGRRNLYTVHIDRPLRSRGIETVTVGELLRLLTSQHEERKPPRLPLTPIDPSLD